MIENKFQITEFADGAAEAGNLFFHAEGFSLTVVPVDDSECNRELHAQGLVPCKINDTGNIKWVEPSILG